MYGYVRPLKGELKVSEYETFHNIYCALCRELSRRGGFFARFVINYDFTFLAMLLSREDAIRCETMRCPARLGRKRSCVCANDSLALAADESIILAWWKLTDAITDSPFFKAIPYRLARAAIRPAYRKSQAAQPAFAKIVRHALEELAAMEREGTAPLDAVADRFAVILRAAAAPESDDNRRRTLEQLLYQLGRFVYILDAADDLQDDWQSGSYNPLIRRFSISDGKLSEEQTQQLRQILCQAQNSIAATFALLDKGCWHPVLANTIYYGLPWVSESVLSGSWNKRKQDRRLHERSL